MLKVTLLLPDGKRVLLIGLTFANLDALREGAGDVFVKIDAAEQVKLSHDVLVFAGETEAHLAAIIELTGAEFTTDTIVNLPDKLKN